MTNPRVLVKLDVLIGLLGVIAALLALQIVIQASTLGLLAVLILGLAVTVGVNRYRDALREAAE